MSMKHIQDLYRHDIGSFFDFAFRELHPYDTFHPNWHIEVLAHNLKQVADGKITRLLINMPPRTLKSYCVSTAFVAWQLGRNPRMKILCLHAGHDLGVELHEQCSSIMSSRRYRSLFPHAVATSKKKCLQLIHGGKRQYMTMQGRLTGLGADVVIVDDPLGTLESRDEAGRNAVNQQFDDNILQRLNNKKAGAIIVVMQRLHENDLSGHILKKQGWTHVNIPAIALEDERWDLPYGQTYHRRKREVIHAERESPESLHQTLLDIGGNAFAYQYLQGLYKPYFDENGSGCIFLSPYRQGEHWDAFNPPENRWPMGFYNFKESDLLLPKVFGIGADPRAENMRHNVTVEEWKIMAEHTKQYQANLLKEHGM